MLRIANASAETLTLLPRRQGGLTWRAASHLEDGCVVIESLGLQDGVQVGLGSSRICKSTASAPPQFLFAFESLSELCFELGLRWREHTYRRFRYFGSRSSQASEGRLPP